MTARDAIEIRQRDIPPSLERPSPDYPVLLEQLAGLFGHVANIETAAHTADFVLKRLRWLQAEVKPKSISVIANTFEKGFIHPESDVKRSAWNDPFHVDDPQLYMTFLKVLDRFRTDSAWADRPLRDMIAFAAQDALGDYFGNHAGCDGIENQNQEFYETALGGGGDMNKRYVSLSQLRNKNIATCAEKAPALQNLFVFVGLHSYLVFSGSCVITGEPSEPPHAYNIVHSERGYFIVDPTNPQILKRPHGEIVGYRPAMYPITAAQFQALQHGAGIAVDHTDLLVRDTGEEEKFVPHQRVYGAPAKSLVVLR